jgi:xanthine dehydrogenase accessory factor
LEIMKNWNETAHIIERLAGVSERGDGAALAMVIAIEGSAYRRPGAKLLIEPEGATLGGVSGGCLEADVRELGLAAIEDGETSVRRYVTGDDEDTVWGLGLGCDGTVEVCIQPITAEWWVAGSRVQQLLKGDDAFAVATVVEGSEGGRVVVIERDGATHGSTGDGELDGGIARDAARRLAAEASGLTEIGSSRVFIELLEPPPHVLIVGAGDDAQPLAEIGGQAGFRVTVIDHRPAYLTEDRFPATRTVHVHSPGEGGFPEGSDTYAVVMTHNLTRDREWVTHFLLSDVPYIGLLGPRSRRAEILSGADGADTSRVFGPVGLDVGADGPEQVAIAIVAELLAVRAARTPRHLRERVEPIHEPA